MIISGAYDPFLVSLSLFIAVFASFTGLSLGTRMAAASGHAKTIWLFAAAFALGGGIWSMHFVGMMAFSLPGMVTRYDPGLTFLSLVIPIVLTGWALALATPKERSLFKATRAGLVMGSGVLVMHYLGMAAMQMSASINYEPFWVGVSVVIAYAASTTAIFLAFHDHSLGRRLAASVAMGIAIAGMHYSAMAAANFVSHPMTGAAIEPGIDQTNLAIIIAIFSVSLLVLALGAARVDQIFQDYVRREARNALRLEIADILRENDTNAALEEIALLMGTHFGVARTGYGQLDPIEDYFDYDVCWTDGSVPPLIGRFPAAAFGEKIVAELAAGNTVVVEDLLRDSISDEARTRETARNVETRSILVVPFVRDGRLRTIVYLNDSKPRKWDNDDIAFMEELAERTRLVIERAAVEEELRELNATLEQRVEERTHDLQQAQEALLQSQKMEAVGQLVAGMAHDFNNVLASVIGAFNLIIRKPEEPDRVLRFAKAGAQAAERGAKLTGQLMAFSRAQKIQLRPVLVCDVLQDMEELLTRTLGPLISIEKELNPHPAPVLADATQVEMMILNLAINARDAMPDGGKLTISTRKRAMEEEADLAVGDYIELAVKDTGTGMDAETLRRAMEPFFTTKPVGKGTGLGLAQIYGSARQAGGTVRIESEIGVGTTVRVFLPCTDSEPLAAVEDDPERGAEADVGSLRILLVDDDIELRTVIADSLSDLGHEVIAVGDGEEALSLLNGDIRPDIAILDFAMPGMNGAAVAQRIAKHLPSLPILFVSGYADTEMIKNAAGANATIIQKPFDLTVLEDHIRKYVVATSMNAAE